MIIRNSQVTKCINSHDRLHITFSGKDHICFCHCCRRPDEKSGIIAINTLYNLSKEEFKNLLLSAYTKIPENHRYETDFYCQANANCCVYNDRSLKFVAVDIFRYCNIHCPMCYISKTQFMTFDENKKLYFFILNNLKGLDLDTIQLTGIGEPFMLKKETIEWLSSLNINDVKNIFIITNTTLLELDDIIKLSEISKNTGVKINIMSSCSAITEDIYKIVHNNHNFNKVIENICNLNKYGLLQFINFVIQPENLHELEFYKQFWSELGIDTKKCLSNIIVGDYNTSIKIKNSEEYKNFLQNQ